MAPEWMRQLRTKTLSELVYVDRHGVFSTRRVYLLKLQGNRLIAWDVDKQARRTFYVERILACLPASTVKRARKGEVG